MTEPLFFAFLISKELDMNDSRQREIEQFLYHEARLLDQRRFHEWIELLADDIHYWMPVRTSRYEKTSKSIVILDDEHYRGTELSTASDPHSQGFFVFVENSHFACR